MTNPQVLASAREDLEAIISDVRAAFRQWVRGAIDVDDFGVFLTDFVYEIDDYRKEYAPTEHERFLQARDHAEELARDVFRDAQEDYQ